MKNISSEKIYTSLIRLYLVFAIAIIAAPSVIKAQDSSGVRNNITGFRDSPWGASAIEVLAKERRAFSDSVEAEGIIFLIFQGIVLDRKADIYYGFENGGLTLGYYSFMEDYTSMPERYFTDYDLFKNAIAAQYGPPFTDEWESLQRSDSDVYMKNPGLAGAALTIGSLSRKSRWISSEAEITLLLKGGKGVKTIVCYCKGTGHDINEAYDIITSRENR